MSTIHADVSELPLELPIQQDTKYYLQGEMTIFLVGRSLFRIPRSMLEAESEVFKDMFSYPPPPEGAQGDSDENPIVVPDVQAETFSNIVDVMFARLPDTIPTFTLSCWVDILKIATRLQFDRVRALAIEEITASEPEMDAVEEILLSRAVDVPQWMDPALVKLVGEATVMPTSMAAQLPLDLVMDIWRAHIMFHSQDKRYSYSRLTERQCVDHYFRVSHAASLPTSNYTASRPQAYVNPVTPNVMRTLSQG
ncbi:hypothetical protein BV25DRAFT_794140 [Artomyces pyxidatus]|uniref:Uncharacterized protein n=1 Tax=Artomyces pyxidatus TaxID=48021 RepID=A0ACB8SZ80_9AGAM|nr:hypothetical protein BV25DRAFT_794140 [Artomyces pyxidatus]